jgi:cobalt-zinc-cadmium efflux system protein
MTEPKGHGEHAGHSHAAATSYGLAAGIGLNLLIVVVEVAAGIIAGSLGLLSDAVHNFTDMAALGLTWFAMAQAKKPPTAAKTFGYHRAGILAALTNALVMAAITLWIFYEAYLRLLDPTPVGGAWVILVAALALVANLSIVGVLRRRGSGDINIRSAILHLLGDAAASAAVVVAGLVIAFTAWYPVDPLVSVLLGLAILWGAWRIIREAVEILMEHSPRSVDVDALVSELMREEGVLDIHDVHVWTIGSGLYALSCHVLVEDVMVSESNRIIRDLKDMLMRDFGIVHSTLEVETESCGVSGPYCDINHRDEHLPHGKNH